MYEKKPLLTQLHERRKTLVFVFLFMIYTLISFLITDDLDLVVKDIVPFLVVLFIGGVILGIAMIVHKILGLKAAKITAAILMLSVPLFMLIYYYVLEQ